MELYNINIKQPLPVSNSLKLHIAELGLTTASRDVSEIRYRNLAQKVWSIHYRYFLSKVLMNTVECLQKVQVLQGLKNCSY